MKKDDFFKQYQTKEWYEISKRIKARDKNTCQMCGCNDKPLSVHHLFYAPNGSIFDVPDSALITLCEDCHNEQKEYREDTLSLLDSFRCLFTDYEIHELIYSLHQQFVADGPVYYHTPTPIGSHNIHIFDEDSRNNLLRISKWREKVLGEKLKRDALIEYKVFGGSEEIEKWFLKTFGESIFDCVKRLKSDAPELLSEINNEIKARLKRRSNHGNS